MQPGRNLVWIIGGDGGMMKAMGQHVPKLAIGGILLFNLVTAVFRLNSWPFNTLPMFTMTDATFPVTLLRPALWENGKFIFLPESRECKPEKFLKWSNENRLPPMARCLKSICRRGVADCRARQPVLVERRLYLGEGSEFRVDDHVAYNLGDQGLEREP
jgi:hypothetical protein